VQIPAEAINKLEKLEATGVPYKSSPDAMTDVIGGRAQFMVVDLASSQPQVKAGRLRALAVTSSKRTSLAPDLPTVEETLGIKDFDLAAWTGLFGPANLLRRMQIWRPRWTMRSMLSHYLQHVPTKRVAQPSELAGAVLYLVSPAASYTTGVCLPVDGGYLVK
jgi:tripartite-type tricarboxylate transporter receptor subunit TctC